MRLKELFQDSSIINHGDTMKYFIGYFFALSLFYVITKLQEYYNIFNQFDRRKFMPNQSRKHQINYLFKLHDEIKKPEKQTQSKMHSSKTNIRVIVMEDQAYWIKDNIFYTADILGDGVDKETTRRVDTMVMNKVQLDKMMFIIDRLREGNSNDSGSTRN